MRPNSRAGAGGMRGASAFTAAASTMVGGPVTPRLGSSAAPGGSFSTGLGAAGAVVLGSPTRPSRAAQAGAAMSGLGASSQETGPRKSSVTSTQSGNSSPTKSPLTQTSLVRAMKGSALPATVVGLSGTSRQASPRDSESLSDGEGSECSHLSVRSNLSTLSTMSGTSQSGVHGGGGRGGNGMRRIHMSVDANSIEIEASDKIKMSLCTDFKMLCGEGSHAEGLMQCLQMYGYDAPNKLQQRIFPAILHLMGRQLSGQMGATGKGKSCITVQAAAGAGKTSAAVLSVLAAIDTSLSQPQAIFLSASPKGDVDKFLRVFTLMQTVTYQAFNESEEHGATADFDDNSPEVRNARFAHILVGHPRQMLRVLSSCASVNLDLVRMLVIDDVHELMHGATEAAQALAAGPAERKDTSGTSGTMRLIGLPSGDKHAGVESDAALLSSCPQACSGLTSPIEDVVSVCNTLEARQYAQNMSGTFSIRSGSEESTKVRYALLSQDLSDPGSRRVLKLLKNSLMKKRNLLGAENCAPPTKLIKSMKHYFAAAPRSSWVQVFAGLVQSLMFPRALIFCDEEDVARYHKEMQDLGIAVSANLPSSGRGGESQAEVRRRAVHDFTSNKSQFLLSHSEPAVCQMMLPKVSCVFHFGLPQQTPSVYGVRLMPLDAKNGKDSASILLVENSSKPNARPPLINTVGKLFDISFMDMPWEFLPTSGNTTAGGGGRR